MRLAFTRRMYKEFDETPNRRETGSLKWDLFRKQDILPFWVADMDFVSPPAVLQAMRQRVEHGVFGYAMPKPSEQEAVLEYLERQHGAKVDLTSLVWLPGLVPALSAVCRTSALRGARSSLTCTPVYPPFLSTPRDGDLEGLTVPLIRDEQERATFDFDAMEQVVRPDTKLFILCNPHNPVGRVYDRDEISALIDFCNRHDLILCSDEIHCDLILNDKLHKHHSLLGFNGPIQERAITLMAASKTYNIAGVGCAFAIIPDPNLRRDFKKAAGGWLPPVSVFGYTATEAAYRYGDRWRRHLLRYLTRNRDSLLEFMKTHVPEVRIDDAIEATYLAWFDVRFLEHENPMFYFQKFGIGLSNGADFGMPGFLRFNFGCSHKLMLEGLTRFQAGVEAWREAQASQPQRV